MRRKYKQFVVETLWDPPRWPDLLLDLIESQNGKIDGMDLLMPMCLLSDFLYFLSCPAGAFRVQLAVTQPKQKDSPVLVHRGGHCDWVGKGQEVVWEVEVSQDQPSGTAEPKRPTELLSSGSDWFCAAGFSLNHSVLHEQNKKQPLNKGLK